MTTVSVYSYTQSVTYVTDNILKSLKDILRVSGLDPTGLVGDWDALHRGIKAWIDSQHLELVILEVYHPKTDALIIRWDISVSYTWDSAAGNFWTDTEQLKYAIKKAGLMPIDASYRVVVTTADGRPEVSGWSSSNLRSTDGFVRQSLGTTIEHNGLGANTTYWRST